jgi:hypothetical protein
MRVEGAVRLCNACKTTEEKLVLWTLLDTGLEGVRTARPDALTPPVASRKRCASSGRGSFTSQLKILD